MVLSTFFIPTPFRPRAESATFQLATLFPTWGASTCYNNHTWAVWQISEITPVFYTNLPLCSPNEAFGRMNKRWNPDFRLTFQLFVAQIEYSRPWKVLRKSGFHLLFLLPKDSFGMDNLVTNFQEFGTTNRWRFVSKMGWFHWFADGCASHHMLLRTFVIMQTWCSPKRRFWKEEQKMKCGFSKHFSIVRQC